MLRSESADFISWNCHLHVALYNSCVVMLNEASNDFIFFDRQQSEFLESILNCRYEEVDQNSRDLIDELMEQDILMLARSRRERPFASVKSNAGSYQCEWRSGEAGWKFRALRILYVSKAVSYLKHAHGKSVQGHLKALLDDLRQSSASPAVTVGGGAQRELVEIGRNINFALKVISPEIKCLEYAYCFARIAFEAGIECRFTIGVQTFPFLSHAWVAGPEGVVFDSADLDQELATLVEIRNGDA
jgi:hypothetical protein